MTKWARESAIPIGLALSAVFLFGGRPAGAQTFPASDTVAGYIVFPKVVVDVTATPGALQTDTFIQLTNTSRTATRAVQCFYIDSATWDHLDFQVELSPGQPTAWSVREGAGPIKARGDVFTGELKCVEVDDLTTPVPIRVNDIKGEATIYTVSSGSPGFVDVRSYNAIGLQITNVSTGATPSSIGTKCSFGTKAGAACSSNDDCGGGTCGVTMCLGATTGSAECPTGDYVTCPNTLILNNFFDRAIDPVSSKAISTKLTFVPCTEDIIQATPEAQPRTSVQFLIFNEFEQRMSTATQVQCYKETFLSNIDAKPGAEDASVFNVAVQGTLVGQTRIRPVQVASDTSVGHGLLAIAEEFHGAASVAVNLNQVGVNQGKGDFVRYLP